MKGSSEKEYLLAENDKFMKNFTSQEVHQIFAGTLDYTQFFKKNPKSTERLMKALKGRPTTLGFIEPEGFSQNIEKLKKDLEDYKKDHDFESPP